MANPYGLSDDEYGQLEFYASLSGMSVEDYLKMQAANQGDQQSQAPQKQYENSGGADFINSRDEAFIRQGYEDGPKQDGMSYTEYKRQVYAANPEGTYRYQTGDPQHPTALMTPEEIYQLTGQRVGGYQPSTTAGGGAGGAGSASAQQQALQRAIQQNTQQQTALNSANAQRQNDYWNSNVQPALGQVGTSFTNLQNANRQGENEIQQGGVNLNNSLGQTQLARTGAINSANAAQSQALGSYTSSLNNINSNQDQLYNTLRSQAAGYNANQTGLYNNLNSSLTGISQNQTGLFNNLSGQLQGLNKQQSAANDAFQGQLKQLTNAQNAANTSYKNNVGTTIEAERVAAQALQAQLGSYDNAGDQYVADYQDQQERYNAQDESNYYQYLADTQDLMNRREAQKSDPKYVQQMQDSYDLYKKNSNPEVTAQERFIAEQARLKNENDFKSARDATVAQLQGRGLNSGGQQIAAMYGQRQQTAQDRVLAELGIQSNAVGRGLENQAGAAATAQALRNSDDAMRQFQDQYYQAESQRLQGVAGDRQAAGLATYAQLGNRSNNIFSAQRGNLQDKTGRAGMVFQGNTTANQFAADQYGNIFNADTVTNNANTQRAGMGFDANTTTINNNGQRYNDIFNAGTATNNANTQRSGMIFDAGTTTNNANFGRDQSVANYGLAGNQLKSSNAGSIFNANTVTNDSNFNRSNIGFNAADQNALTQYGTVRDLANTRSSNYGQEAGIAQGNAGIALSGSGAYNGMQNTLTRSQSDALNQALGNQLVADTYNSSGGAQYSDDFTKRK